MPEEIENPNPTSPATPAAKKPVTRAPKLKIDGPMKPEIEGINKIKTTPAAPSTAAKLTDQEKQLLSDDIIPETSTPKQAAPKLMPQSVIQRETQKPSHTKTVVVTIIILLILAMGGYEAYLWHMEKQAEVGQTTTNNPPTNQQDDTSIIMSPITDNGASSTPSSTPDSTVSTSTPATSTPPAATTPQIKVKSTPTGYLNVRATPSSAGTLLTQIHPGEIYPFSDKSNGWYKITLTDGTFGWVSGQYVTEQ